MSKNTNNPLNLNIELQNLGKINQATIKLRPFTVIAGCNGSGKSFVTRTLYSMFDSATEKKLFTDVFSNYGKIIAGINFIEENFEASDTNLSNLLNLRNSLEESFGLGKKNDNENLDIFEHLNSIAFNGSAKICDDICSTTDLLTPTVKTNSGILKNFEKRNEESRKMLNDLLPGFLEDQKKAIKSSCIGLKKIIGDPNSFIELNLSKILATSLADSFMVKNTSEIIRNAESHAEIRVAEFGKIEIFKDEIKYSYPTFFELNKSHSGPSVYLESPIYWKLTDALKSAKTALAETAQKRRLEENQLVSQVPKYFFDLMELLEVQVKTNEFSDIVRTIEEAINGNLSFSDGNIQFNDKNSNASVGLNLTALGVTNLGMIALLLKRGAILPGTFLFIDEPEVHLHPSWQVVLIQVLHELSKRGVNVVIASHSIDIMKTIENIMDTDDSIDPQTHFGINQLTKEGNSVDESDNNYKRLAAIKEDLGRPFFEMFVDSLGA